MSQLGNLASNEFMMNFSGAGLMEHLDALPTAVCRSAAALSERSASWSAADGMRTLLQSIGSDEDRL